MKLFERIIYALYRKRKLLMVILAVGVVLYPVIVHAQNAPATQPQPQTEEQITQDMQAYMLVILRAMTAIFWPILMLIGGLLDNSLIFDGKMGETLLQIWVQVRNIVNIIFVVILVLIALYNVLGLGENGPEQLKPLELKQALPKFVIALIVVNFSYIGMKVALDFTNVMTTAVFALPSQVVASSKNFQDFQAENEQIICEPDAPFYGLFCKSEKQEIEGQPPTFSRKFNDRGRAWFAQLDRSNLAVTMAMQFGQLPYANRIQDSVEGIFQLTFNIIFNLVLFIVYAISFIVLFIVLVARLPVLWLGIALSPLAALTLAFPPIKGLIGGEGGDFGKKFVKHAIAPLVIGVSLAIGYIMVSAMKSDPGVHNGDFAVSLLDIDPNALITRIDDLQEVLMAAATIAVVWMGVFAAAKDTIAEGVTNTIKERAQDVGKFVAKLPMYAQVIPYKKGKGVGLGNILASAERIGQETMQKLRHTTVEEVGEEKPKKVQEMLHTDVNDERRVLGDFHDGRLGTATDPQVRAHIAEAIEKMNLEHKDAVPQLKSATNPGDFARALNRVANDNRDRRELQPFLNPSIVGEIESAAREMEKETSRESAETSGSNTITNDTDLHKTEILQQISTSTPNFADQAIFHDMSPAQIKAFADKILALTEPERAKLISIVDGDLRFRDPTSDTYQEPLLDAAIVTAKAEAAQTPATPPTTPPGVPPKIP